MVRELESAPSTASEQLRYFTDREDKKEVFRRCLDIPEGFPLPILNFHGVAGAGKTSLCKHLRLGLNEVPSAWLDFDDKSGGKSYLNDTASALALIRSQFEVSCPSFDVAYALLRFKEGRREEPAIAGQKLVSNSFEFLLEFAQALTSSVPGGNVVAWVAKKISKPMWDGVRETPLGTWIESATGNADIMGLRRKQAQEIYPELNDRLLRDLKKQLPAREGKSCRGVVFLDTFEVLRENVNLVAEQHQRENWVRELYRTNSGLLLVIFGRDKIQWDEVDTDFKEKQYLETHCVGGLSYDDSLRFLRKCGITNPILQEAILRVCCERPSGGARSPSDPRSSGYHPLSLGLCVDTVQAEQRRGRETEPESFSMGSNDLHALAQRFLKSLQSRNFENWILKLSATPRFDYDAAVTSLNGFFSAPFSFSDARGEWTLLIGQSFVSEIGNGWYSLHSLMRQALRNKLGLDDARMRAVHEEWLLYWSSRSDAADDGMRALAWYHSYYIDPVKGLQDWKSLAETARKECRMVDHFHLLAWWQGVSPSKELKPDEIAFEDFSKGNEASEATVGNQTQNLTDAIAYYNATLGVYSEGDYPLNWAQVQSKLGAAYTQLPTGNKEENLRRAINFQTAALRVYTEQTFPKYWASGQLNLGEAHMQLRMGNKDEHLRSAIDFFTAASRIYTEEPFPETWARAQNGLGTAYRQLPTGNRKENLRLAVDFFAAALRVYTDQDFPVGWATTQANLGICFTELPIGSKADNLHRAIEYFTASLRVRTEREFPVDWAGTQVNLGTAYSELPTVKKEENLRRAVEHFTAALRVYTENDFPWAWAWAQTSLGVAHRQLPDGGKVENLSRAVDYFRSALRVYTEREFPTGWAWTQDNLGLAFQQLRVGNRDDNLHRAIEFHDAALRVYTEQAFPEYWAWTQVNLGSAYCQLQSGHNDDNFRRAIECHHAALRVFTEQDLPEAWARTMASLGTVYHMYRTDITEEDLLNSITFYTSALRVYTKIEFPMDWVLIQANLALAYDQLPIENKEENLRRVIGCYTAMLDVYTQASYPKRWAEIQKLLSIAHDELSHSNRSGNVGTAKSLRKSPNADLTNKGLSEDAEYLQIPIHLLYEIGGSLP